MKSLINYLEFHEDIHNIFYLLEDDVSFILLSGLCSKVPIRKLCLAGKDKKFLYQMKRRLHEDSVFHSYKLPEIKILTYDKEICTDAFSDPYDAVIFDPKVSAKAIMSARAFKPKYLIGKIWKDCVSYFDVWESYREISEHIYLKCVIENNKEEVLSWDRESLNDIELSVIFPVYNVAKYLRQCIESVTAWKAPYIEFLFVNDGSPDNSAEIIQEYCQKDQRIKLINKPNGGCASARKLGLERAQGRYIGFIDPDDFVDKEMFKKLIARALLGSYDVCYSGYNVFYETSGKSEHVEDTIRKPYSLGISDSIMIKQLIMYCRVAIWRGIYKREFLKANKITFNEAFRRFDDLPFKVEVFAKARSVVSIPEYLYYYRLERPGQDMSANDERLYVHFDIFNYLNKKMRQINNQRLYDYLQICKIQTHCFALQKIDRKYALEYAHRARKDFQTNRMTVLRTLLLIKKYIDFKSAVPYLAIMYNCSTAYLKCFDWRCEHTGKRRDRKNAQMTKKLLELSK